MTVKTNIKSESKSDAVILQRIGMFIKAERVARNKTQDQLAIDCGINRYTIGQIEKGESITLKVLIPILRGLNRLDVLDLFATSDLVSPLEAVKLKKKKRQRASPKKETSTKKSDW